MNEIIPAYLAQFIYLVPEGATIPAGTEHVARTGDGFLRLCTYDYDHKQQAGYLPRWTREPITVPEPPTLTERARVVVRESTSGSRVRRLAAIVAELAERIEGDR